MHEIRKSVYQFTYMDWVLDSIRERLMVIQAAVSDPIFPDTDSYISLDFSVRAQIETPFRTYYIEVNADSGHGPVTQNWSVYAWQGEEYSEKIFSEKWGGFMLNIDPSDETPLYRFEPYKTDFLRAGAIGIGEKIGEAIAADLYDNVPDRELVPMDGIGLSHFSISLPIVRKHGLTFFNNLFRDLLVHFPDLTISGPVRPPRDREFYLVLSFETSGKKYVFTCGCTDEMEPNTARVFTDSSWYLTRNYLWDENTEHLSQGYYSVIHNFTGKRLRNEVLAMVVDTLRYDQGLHPLFYPTPNVPAQDISHSPSQEPPISQVDPLEIMARSFDPKSLFLIPKGKRNAQVLSTPVPDEVLEVFKYTTLMDQSSFQIVADYLSNVWITWENQNEEIRKARLLAPKWADDVWESAYPTFEQVRARYTRAGYAIGPEFSAWAWLGTTLGVFYVFATGNVLLLLLGITALALGHIYARSQHRPSFQATKLMQKQKDLKEAISHRIAEEIEVQFKGKVAKGFGAGPDDWALAVNHRWQPLCPRPLMPPAGLTPAEAEVFTGQYLKFFGFSGVRITRHSKDGGIDVASNSMAVQVKHQDSPVGVKVVREIFGVATAGNLHAGVFARKGFTREAVDFSDLNDIALFSYDPQLVAHTKAAHRILENGADSLS